MNFSLIAKDLLNKKYTDVILYLKDNDMTIELSLHKIFLIGISEYFNNLFTFHPDKKEFTIIVPNAIIMRNLILSYYGVPNQKTDDIPDYLYTLGMIMCRNFLCLEVNDNDLSEIEVPPEYFVLLIDVVGLFEPNHRLLSIIKKNMPSDFDLNSLDDKYAKYLTMIDNIIAISSGMNVNIYNFHHGIKICCLDRIKFFNNLSKKIPRYGLKKKGYKITNNIGYNNRTSKLPKKYLETMNENYPVSMTFSPCNIFLLISTDKGYIELWDILHESLIDVSDVSDHKEFNADYQCCTNNNFSQIIVYNTYGKIFHYLEYDNEDSSHHTSFLYGLVVVKANISSDKIVIIYKNQTSKLYYYAVYQTDNFSIINEDDAILIPRALSSETIYIIGYTGIIYCDLDNTFIQFDIDHSEHNVLFTIKEKIMLMDYDNQKQYMVILDNQSIITIYDLHGNLIKNINVYDLEYFPEKIKFTSDGNSIMIFDSKKFVIHNIEKNQPYMIQTNVDTFALNN